MYNTDLPIRAELPSTQKLLRSTMLAILTAAVLLIAIVLPSEYAIDPTGVGRALGLTKMGEIKTQLAKEAEQDAVTAKTTDTPSASPAGATAAVTPATSDVVNAAMRSDQMNITLQPNESAEVKLSMKKGALTKFSWRVIGGAVNFDTHGDQGDAIKYHGYGKGKGSAGETGQLEAAFDGHHGWFWRNRGDKAVTLTLDTQGAYQDIKRML